MLWRRRCPEFELSFAAIVCTNGLFQSEGPLEFRSITLLADELGAECLKFFPPRLLISDRAVPIWTILKMAPEILNLSPRQTREESVFDARHRVGFQLNVPKQTCERRS